MTENSENKNFIGALSKDGTYSPHIGAKTARRMIDYCSHKKLNKVKFVERCINERLDVLEKEYYDSLSREELIGLIDELKKKTN